MPAHLFVLFRKKNVEIISGRQPIYIILCLPIELCVRALTLKSDIRCLESYSNVFENHDSTELD